MDTRGSIKDVLQQEQERGKKMRLSPLELEEERVWAAFYRNVSKPWIAGEIILFLDQDPDLKQRRSGLYLRARESVQRNKLRQAKIQRASCFVRVVCRWLFVVPFAGLGRVLRFGGAVAVSSLPGPVEEPAMAQLRRMREQTLSTAASPDPSAQDPAPERTEEVQRKRPT